MDFNQKFKEKKIEEIKENLLTFAEKIIKEKQCRIRQKNINLLKKRCAKDIKFELKAQYVDEKIELMTTAFNVGNIPETDKEKKLKELLEFKKRSVQVEKIIKRKETQRAKTLQR